MSLPSLWTPQCSWPRKALLVPCPEERALCPVGFPAPCAQKVQCGTFLSGPSERVLPHRQACGRRLGARPLWVGVNSVCKAEGAR